MLVLALIIVGTIAACDAGKSTTIVSKTNDSTIRIKYAGKVVFNEAQDGIDKISKGGYLEFELNGKRFKAEQGKYNNVDYRFNGDDKINILSDDQKHFVAQAVKIVIKKRRNIRH